MQKRKNKLGITVLRYLLSTAMAAAVVFLFRSIVHVNTATVALSFLVLILLVATRWRLAHSVYMSVLCSVLYNFFFLPPIGKITISDPQNWVALGAFLSTSVLVSQLSERERRQREIAELRQADVERLYDFSQRLMLHDDFHHLARAIPSLAASSFGLRAVALYVLTDDKAYHSDPKNELMPLESMKKIANNSEQGIRKIDDAYVFPLLLGLQSFGLLVVADEGYSEQMYEAIGGMIAISLERVAALERTSHMEAMREGERLRTALLDSVTHELRTPLTAIRAAATMLIGHPEIADSDRNEMYAVVDEESLRLDRLIGEAVDMAQLDSSGLQVHLRLENIREVIGSVLDEENTRLRGREVLMHIPDALPAVPMDRELVSRVLRHLIENAIQYSPVKSAITIRAEVAESRFWVHVGNEGVGIDPAEQPYVFDKFFRGSNQRLRMEGSGMGLAIAKAILVAHGGGISVKSEPGKGAIFTFWLALDASPPNA